MTESSAHNEGSGGLLTAALFLKKKTFFEEAGDSFQESASVIPRTTDAPAALFSRFVESYRIAKGALLLSGHDSDICVQAASTGYDLTTIRRLRIPASDFPAVSPTVYRGNDTGSFRAFFSVREFSVIENILLIPGVIGDTVSAFIIVTDGEDFLFADPPSFPDEILHAITGGTHDFHLHVKDDVHPLSVEQADSILSRILEEYGSASVGLMKCAPVLTFLKKKHPQGDPFVLLHRGITFVASQLKKSFVHSEIIELFEGTLLIILPEVPASRAGALFHQASLSLRSRFGETAVVPSVSISPASAPDNGMSVSELFPDYSLPA